jgi:hypothetical protein
VGGAKRPHRGAGGPEPCPAGLAVSRRHEAIDGVDSLALKLRRESRLLGSPNRTLVISCKAGADIFIESIFYGSTYGRYFSARLPAGTKRRARQGTIFYYLFASVTLSVVRTAVSVQFNHPNIHHTQLSRCPHTHPHTHPAPSSSPPPLLISSA